MGGKAETNFVRASAQRLDGTPDLLRGQDRLAVVLDLKATLALEHQLAGKKHLAEEPGALKPWKTNVKVTNQHEIGGGNTKT